MLAKIKKAKLKLSDFMSIYKKNVYLVSECKRKDLIIKAQKEQLDILKNAMNSTKEL